MSQKPAIVTAERFASGLTYKEYMAQIKQYKDRFEQYYNSAKISPDDAACFKKASQGKNGAVRILALAEDWSSDVYRELPVIARIAEAVKFAGDSPWPEPEDALDDVFSAAQEEKR